MSARDVRACDVSGDTGSERKGGVMAVMVVMVVTSVSVQVAVAEIIVVAEVRLKEHNKIQSYIQYEPQTVS